MIRFVLCSTILFSSLAYAHNGDDKKFGFRSTESKTAKFGVCEAVIYGVDWDQPLLRDQSELRKFSETRASSRIWSPWMRALGLLPQITDAIDRVPAEKRFYFLGILRAIEASLTKHQLEFAKVRDLGKMDVPRHMKILNEIAAFSAQKPEFSLYKIKRAIDGRYSLREYAGCK